MTVDKKTKAAKSHHVPTRMCVACGIKKASSQLLRVIKDGNGRLELDRHRRKGGRGAYVCLSEICFRRALSRNLFSRALRGRVLFDRKLIVDEFGG